MRSYLYRYSTLLREFLQSGTVELAVCFYQYVYPPIVFKVPIWANKALLRTNGERVWTVLYSGQPKIYLKI